MRALWLLGALGVLLAMGAGAQEEEIVLPRQMGAINDYAAILSAAGRTALQKEIDQIKQNFDVQLVLLATIFDPFDDAPRFAQSIWESWQLGERTALLLFTKERAERWVFALRLGEALRNTIRLEHIDRLQQGLKAHLERRRVQTAMEEAVTALHAMLDGSYGQPPPAPHWEFELGWLWGVLLIMLLLGLVFTVRVFLKNLCPRCGIRMRTYHSYGRRNAPAAYRSCPRCGYARLRS